MKGGIGLKPKGVTIRSAARALNVLRFLSTQPHGSASLSHIAADLDMNLSSAHHLVSTLVAAGYLQQNPENKRYHFGPGALGLAAAILSQVDMLQAARQPMEQFAATAQEAVTLSVADGAFALALSQTEPGGIMRGFASGDVRRVPLYCTAAGKVLCLDLPEADVRERLALQPMDRRTPRTRTTPEEFLGDLGWARTHRVAIDNEEWTQGVCSVAVPVYNYAGNVVAALSSAGPRGRMDGEHLNTVMRLLRQAGEAVSRQLGYIPVGRDA